MADRLVIRTEWPLILCIVWLAVFNMAVVVRGAEKPDHDFKSSTPSFRSEYVQ